MYSFGIPIDQIFKIARHGSLSILIYFEIFMYYYMFESLYLYQTFTNYVPSYKTQLQYGIL